MKIDQIETPALLLDLDKMKKNISQMSKILENSKAKLRPHFKTTKTLEVVKLQLENGAKGVTCSKISEAQVLVDAGIKDILIANQIVQPSKIERLTQMAKQTHLIVCVDNAENIKQISQAAQKQNSTIFMYIELEVGMKRCGVETKEQFLELAKLIESLPNISFEGIQAYAGQLSHEADIEKKKTEVEKTITFVKSVKEYLEENGIAVKEVSGSSSCTSMYKAASNLYTEIQAGSYIYMDAALKPCNLPFESSLFVLTTVISKNHDRIVIDCGAKSLGLDQVYPIFLGFESNQVSLSEEHFSIYGNSIKQTLNDKVMLIPGHCCTTVNIYDKLYLIQNDEVIAECKIAGREKSI